MKPWPWPLGMVAILMAGAPADGRSQTAPKTKLESFVEQQLGVYFMTSRRRHPLERVVVRGSSIHVNVWRPIGDDQDIQLKTEAVKWLVFGRTQFNHGVGAIFGEYSRVKDIQIRFLDIVKPRRVKRGSAKEKSKIYLMLKITRKRFERLNGERLRGCIERGDCSKSFRSLFSSARFDRAYTKKVRSK